MTFISMTSALQVWKLSLVFSLILLLCTVALRAQSQDYPQSRVGLRAGPNLNSWTNEFPYLEFEGQRVFPDAWEATTGFHMGMYFNVRLGEIFAIEPGIMYTRKGTGTTLDLGSSIMVKGTVVSNYIDLPLLLRLYVAEGFNLYAGPQFSYHFGSTYSLTVNDEFVIQDEDTSNGVSELDTSLVLGVGYEFAGGFNMNLGGEFGFLTVDSFDELSTFNRTIRLSLGYTF